MVLTKRNEIFRCFVRDFADVFSEKQADVLICIL